MKQILRYQIVWLLMVTMISCKDEPTPNILNEPNCRIAQLNQYETGVTVPYKELTFTYEGFLITRIDTKTRGVADGYRRITYDKAKATTVTFYDKDNKLLTQYNFTYDANGWITSVDIHYANYTPAIMGSYKYTYDNKGNITKLSYYHNEKITQVIEYTYKTGNNTEIIRSEIFDVSATDPTYKLKTGISEYVYDNKPSPNHWPAFTWSQNHQTQLDLLLPPSLHNLTNYTHYAPRSLGEEEPVFVVDESVSFTTNITYTERNYPQSIVEKRANSQIRYDYSYVNCSK
ncbi:hypothetical protein D3C72_569440 [compost metagenome]